MDLFGGVSPTSLAFTGVTALIGVTSISGTAYLLTLLGAAAVAKRRAIPVAPLPRDRVPRLAVVIPAHDEEPVIAATLASLAAQDYPSDRFAVFVIADNCTDATAAVARASGATVLERFDADRRGKGYALDWAISRLLSAEEPANGFVIVDADTWVAPDFLSVVAERLDTFADAEGRCALQGRYGVLNSEDGWRASLMAGAFDLYNHVRPLGGDRLGLNVGLKGNGMAFSRPTLESCRWSGHSITEDIDYGLDLIRHSIPVRYVPQALVRAQMPVTARQAASQRERWEFGRFALLRERTLPLLGEAARRRNRRLADAAVGLLLPPLAEMAALLTLWGAAIAAGRAGGLLPGGAANALGGAWLLASLGFVAYVLIGLRVAGAPRAAYAALLRAPLYAAWKFALIATRPLRRRRAGKASGPGAEWVRTERVAIPPSGPLKGPSA